MVQSRPANAVRHGSGRTRAPFAIARIDTWFLHVYTNVHTRIHTWTWGWKSIALSRISSIANLTIVTCSFPPPPIPSIQTPQISILRCGQKDNGVCVKFGGRRVKWENHYCDRGNLGWVLHLKSSDPMFMEREGESDEGERTTLSGFILNRTDSLKKSYSISTDRGSYIKATFFLCDFSKNNVVLKRLF